MKYCMIKNGSRIIQGNSLHDVIDKAIFYTIEKRKDSYYLIVDNKKDTITYSLKYSLEEVTIEIIPRLMVLLSRKGWAFYKEI